MQKHTTTKHLNKNKMKKETLEEAAEKYADFSNDYVPLAFGSKFNETTKRDFKEGAKWQAERMYSEEEVLNILDKFLVSMLKGEKTGLTEKWFEQFKKK